MVTLFQHSFYKSSTYESHKGDSQYLYPSENLKMPFYCLCCHGKFVTMSVMLTYFMLQIGFTKINFCHVSFALIFNGLKIGKVF